jgi:hypothetical protein
MTRHAIYIPTKSREEFAAKCARSLSKLNTGIPIYVTTEEQHSEDLYEALAAESKRGGRMGVSVYDIPRNDIGLGATRQEILKHAKRHKLDSIAMIDDDQDMKGDIAGWLEVALREDVVGVGAWKGIYGLLDNKTELAEWVKAKKHPALFACSGGHGHQAFAFNVRNAFQVGGFDEWARWYEDGEMLFKTIKSGRPWWIYTGAVAGDFASQKFLREHKMGGMFAPGSCDMGEEAIYKIWQAKWPKYLSPGKKRLKLKLMYQDYCPEFAETWPPQNTRSSEAWDWCDTV